MSCGAIPLPSDNQDVIGKIEDKEKEEVEEEEIEEIKGEVVEEKQVEQSSDNRCVLTDCPRTSLNRLLNGIVSCS